MEVEVEVEVGVEVGVEVEVTGPPDAAGGPVMQTDPFRLKPMLRALLR